MKDKPNSSLFIIFKITATGVKIKRNIEPKIIGLNIFPNAIPNLFHIFSGFFSATGINIDSKRNEKLLIRKNNLRIASFLK